MTQEYGWYYEEGHVQDTDGDLWDLIDSAVREAVEDERLDGLRVGPMEDWKPSDHLTAVDVIEMIQNEDGQLPTANDFVEAVYGWHADNVHDGSASLRDGGADEFARINKRGRTIEEFAADVVAWADEHIALEPTSSCDGRYPLPIELVDGQWRFGSDDSKHAACVECAIGPASDEVFWIWTAGNDMGEAKTLKEAMRAAEEALKPKPKTPIYAYVPDIGFFPPEPHKPLVEEVIHTTIGGKGVVGRIKR